MNCPKVGYASTHLDFKLTDVNSTDTKLAYILFASVVDAGFKVKNEDKDSDIKKESKNQDNSMIDEDLKQNIKQEPEETVKVKEEEKTDVKEEVIESDDEEDETELVQVSYFEVIHVVHEFVINF